MQCWGRLEAGPDNKQPRARLGARTVPETLSSAGRLLAIPSRRMQAGKGAAAARGRARRQAAGGGLRGLADDGAARERQQAGPGRVALLAWVEWAAAGACGRAGGFDAARSVSAHRSDQGGAGPRSAGMPTVDVTDRTVLRKNAGRKWWRRALAGPGSAEPIGKQRLAALAGLRQRRLGHPAVLGQDGVQRVVVRPARSRRPAPARRSSRRCRWR